MKMMLPDVIGHKNQSQHSAPSMFMSRFIQTDYHAGQIFISHRPSNRFKLHKITFLRCSSNAPRPNKCHDKLSTLTAEYWNDPTVKRKGKQNTDMQKKGSH